MSPKNPYLVWDLIVFYQVIGILQVPYYSCIIWGCGDSTGTCWTRHTYGGLWHSIKSFQGRAIWMSYIFSWVDSLNLKGLSTPLAHKSFSISSLSVPVHLDTSSETSSFVCNLSRWVASEFYGYCMRVRRPYSESWISKSG